MAAAAPAMEEQAMNNLLGLTRTAGVNDGHASKAAAQREGNPVFLTKLRPLNGMLVSPNMFCKSLTDALFYRFDDAFKRYDGNSMMDPRRASLMAGRALAHLADVRGVGVYDSKLVGLVCTTVGIACECAMTVLHANELPATRNGDEVLYKDMFDDCEASQTILGSLIAPDRADYTGYEEYKQHEELYRSGMGDALNLLVALLTELSTKERAIASDTDGERLTTLVRKALGLNADATTPPDVVFAIDGLGSILANFRAHALFLMWINFSANFADDTGLKSVQRRIEAMLASHKCWDMAAMSMSGFPTRLPALSSIGLDVVDRLKEDVLATRNYAWNAASRDYRTLQSHIGAGFCPGLESRVSDIAELSNYIFGKKKQIILAYCITYQDTDNSLVSTGTEERSYFQAFSTFARYTQSLNSVTKIDADALKVKGQRIDPALVKLLRSQYRAHVADKRQNVPNPKVARAVAKFMAATATSEYKEAKIAMIKAAEKSIKKRANREDKKIEKRKRSSPVPSSSDEESSD